MSSYLRAIQEIPGDTASEKLKWIKRFNLKERQESGDLNQLPLELLPILRVENAIKEKIHEDITEALKSEDWMIVKRALQASWFFNGSHKDIVDVEYFREYIFPYVSLNTRVHLVKTLAVRLVGKDPDFAQQMFKMVKFLYGLQQALVLLVACNEDFTYQIVEKKRIALPYKIVKWIFLRNPDFLVRYLRLSKPNNLYKINIHDYKCLLIRLVKKRLAAFVELYEMHEKQPPCVRLSNKCTAIFLRSGFEYVMRKPHLYIKILSLKKIKAAQMESILPGLSPDEVNLYDTRKMLRYLKHFSEDKRLDLLCDAYRRCYGDELLDRSNNVTPALMRLLPVDERVKQAKIKIEQDKLLNITHDMMDYEHAWICYLSINESLPAVKEKLTTTCTLNDILGVIRQIVYTCKINKDDEELFDILLYFKLSHKDEEFWLFELTMDLILRLYELSKLSVKICVMLYDVIRLFYVKHEKVTEQMLVTMIHCTFFYNMSITESIEILLEIQYTEYTKMCPINLKYVLNQHLQFKRQFLVAYIDMVQRKCHSNNWSIKLFLPYILEIMYDFNSRYKKSHMMIERMTIKDYPYLMDAAQQMYSTDSADQGEQLKRILRKNEPELHRKWRTRYLTSHIVNVTSNEALEVLKESPQIVSCYWERYLEECMLQFYNKTVQRFIKAIRWYKDIPVKFLESCMDKLQRRENERSCVVILAMLIDSKTLTKLLIDLLGRRTDTNCSLGRKEYSFENVSYLVARLCNPPMSFDLVAKLYECNYLAIAERSLLNLSRRASLPQVISFAQDLMKKDVHMQKHGIRIMHMVAPIHELVIFFLSVWQSEDHSSIRKVLLQKVQELLYAEPNFSTWSLLSTFMLTLTLDDEKRLLHLTKVQCIPDEYVVKYIQLLYDVINLLVTNGLNIDKAIIYIAHLVENITKSICDRLPDKFIENIIRKYLFHENARMCKVVRRFTVCSYLLSTTDKFEQRIGKFADIFVDKVKNGWNTSHRKDFRFYPINHNVRQFVNDLVITFVSMKSSNAQVIPAMMKIFLSVLTPHMDAHSYLMLVYTIEWMKCPRSEKFGLQLSKKLPELIETFSSQTFFFMAKTLKYFLTSCNNISNAENIEFNTIKGLILTDNTESCFMAVNLLYAINTNNNTSYNYLIKKFRKMNHPDINTILYDYLSSTDYKGID